VVPSTGGRVKVTWKPVPTDVVVSTVTGYVVTPYLGNVAQPARTFHSRASSQFIAGLQNAKTYQFTVAPILGLGTGPSSNKSGKVIVGSPGQPGRPVAAKSQPGTLQVRFAPPGNNGAKITRYTVGCIPAAGGPATTNTAPRPLVTVTGLEPGTKYTCAAKATNQRGTGPGSQRSAATTA